jgi:hypothetical protein
MMEMKRRLAALEDLTARAKNPGVGSWAVFGAMVMMAAGTWGVSNVTPGMTFAQLWTPFNVLTFMGALGSVLGAWLAPAPIHEHKGEPK